MTDLAKQTNIPADFGKMPEGYDFSTKDTDWSSYKKEYFLRTDAVWEKQQLLDWYRCFTKCFYFDKGLKKYRIFEPEDIYTVLFEGWALEDIVDFVGMTPTGRTNSFQTSIPPRQRQSVTFNSFYHQQDYYQLCALRFERWFRCDQVYNRDRETEYDFRLDQSKFKNYPCYRLYYESLYACQDDMFDFLMELAYTRRANDTFESDYNNHEIRQLPTVYDSPKYNDNKVFTY